jgi:Zn-dependent protease
MAGPDTAQQIINVSAAVIPGIFAITMHEVAHGWAAKNFGDPTAYRLGRLSLNPFKHIDPIGTVVLPLAMLWLTGLAFGWAKPVPVTVQNLRNPKRDMIFVAAAGPGANLAMATAWTLLAMLVGAALDDSSLLSAWLLLVCEWGIKLNVLLMVVNLVPIPPLDGGRVLSGLLPRAGSELLDRIEPFGFIIVVLLMLPPIGVLWRIIEPFIRFFVDFFYSAAGLH